ncbi:hypothetical protein DFH11DRAFT_26747 [Phellopilus nigrolimitatus]|nr:hypothetical protein DFH11DRAFT_26747 [Phellopilus nigrolimitatus]
MKSALVGLSFAGAAVAQMIVNGASMVTLSSSDSGAIATASSSGGSYYGSPAPAQATNYASSGGSYYGSSAPAQATNYATSTYGASSSQITEAPSSSMPYESMTAGGYSSMNCGYGYSKAYDGSCKAQSWVSI